MSFSTATLETTPSDIDLNTLTQSTSNSKVSHNVDDGIFLGPYAARSRGAARRKAAAVSQNNPNNSAADVSSASTIEVRRLSIVLADFKTQIVLPLSALNNEVWLIHVYYNV